MQIPTFAAESTADCVKCSSRVPRLEMRKFARENDPTKVRLDDDEIRTRLNQLGRNYARFQGGLCLSLVVSV